MTWRYLIHLLFPSQTRAHDSPALAFSNTGPDPLAGAVHGDADGRAHDRAADPRLSKLWPRWCGLRLRRRRRCRLLGNTPRLSIWLRLEKEAVCSRRSNGRGAGAGARSRSRARARAGLRHGGGRVR